MRGFFMRTPCGCPWTERRKKGRKIHVASVKMPAERD
jgi:hypothetical protein